MILVSVVTIFAGAAFLMIGAWPVVGFLGLDALLIFTAFQLHKRSARLYETVELTEDELRITRTYPSGRSESWSFNPYWAKLELVDTERSGKALVLGSHGRTISFGSFLTDEEKSSFAEALGIALQDMRGSRI